MRAVKDAALNRAVGLSTRRVAGALSRHGRASSVRQRLRRDRASQAYAGALAMVAASTLVGLWIAPRWGTAPVDMIYLPAVLAAAALWGLGPALVAGRRLGARLQFLLHRAGPHLPHRPRRPTSSRSIVLFLVALVTSRLAAGIRSQARLAAAHAARNATIAGFARRLLSCSSEEEIARTACAELDRLFDCNAMLVSGPPEPRIVAAVPDGNRLTPSDIAAAALTIETGEPAGPRHVAQSSPPNGSSTPVRSGDAVARRGRPRPRRRHAAGRRRPAAAAHQPARPGRAGARARAARGEAREFAARARARPGPLGPAVVDRPGPAAAA